ncbi:MAG: ammonia-dependent NAD(+) synthetase [Tatlockia sp.]|nr:ammonia-dependent NAD(+) synthetase [Tatlockia sp.]
MASDCNRIKQTKIIKGLKLSPIFDVNHEISMRINFLKNFLRQTQKKSYILGLSGGIDSTLAGALAQLAIKELCHEDYPSQFIGVRLPYGLQKDEADAIKAVNFIKPDLCLCIDIQPICDSSLAALESTKLSFDNEKQKDFILGNIKARERMVITYALAGLKNGLVIGTDHAAEALTGFFTKFGDGACDLAPLTGLNKRRIRKMAAQLEIPENIINKCPTADLENLAPLRPDEEVLGLSYDQIDDFLEGMVMSNEIYEKIFKIFEATAHKRKLPDSPDEL